MKKVFKITLISFILIFALASCASMSGTASTESSQMRTISVSGSGTITLSADMVTFSINVSETAPTTAEAQQLTNKKINQILAILKNYKIEDKDISTTALSFSTEYYWDSVSGRQIKEGENVSQTVYVKMGDIDRFGALVDELGSSVSGISFYSTSFDKSDKTQAYEEARELAYQDAYNKALKYAQSAGMELGYPITITDGYTSYSNRAVAADGLMKATSVEAAASYKTEAPSGQLSVSSNVSVVFQLLK